MGSNTVIMEKNTFNIIIKHIFLDIHSNILRHTFKLGYDNHSYNEFTFITSKILSYFLVPN